MEFAIYSISTDRETGFSSVELRSFDKVRVIASIMIVEGISNAEPFVSCFKSGNPFIKVESINVKTSTIVFSENGNNHRVAFHELTKRDGVHA